MALILDQYTGWDHKDMESVTADLPGYYDDQQKRRIGAYMAAEAMIRNAGRELLSTTSSIDPDDLQEYGDAAIMVARYGAAILGQDPLWVVVGADVEIPNEPDYPPVPNEPPEGLPEQVARVRQRAYQESLARWEPMAMAALDEWLGEFDRLPKLQARQALLREWAEDVGLMPLLRMMEQAHVVPLGDGVLTFGWDAAKKRPSVQLLEPHAYLPVLSAEEVEEFPSTVVLGWGFTAEDETGEETNYVRRIVYELVPISEAPGPVITPKYHGPDDEHTHTCLLSDGVWLADDLKDSITSVEAPPVRWRTLQVGPDPEVDVVELQRWDTGLDWIPVLHVPKGSTTPSAHFGESHLASVAQLVDEINANDTDESLASRWAARPPVVIKGLPAGVTTIDMTPGKGVAGDDMATVNMAQNLQQIVDRGKGLRKTMSVNGSTPEGLLGRVDASEVPSGLALTLSFTPFEQAVEGEREQRSRKHPLIGKWVQRIAIQNDVEGFADDPVVYATEIRYGAFMPQDLPGTAEVIARLLQVGAVSKETAVRMAQANGVPVDHVLREVERIEEEDLEGAEILSGILGAKAAAHRLGMDDFSDDNAPDPEGPVGGFPAGAGPDTGEPGPEPATGLLAGLGGR